MTCCEIATARSIEIRNEIGGMRLLRFDYKTRNDGELDSGYDPGMTGLFGTKKSLIKALFLFKDCFD
jgi:hypothetical protein